MLFGKKKDHELEALIQEIRVDLSNNYKDNAVSGIKRMETLLQQKESDGSLKEKELAGYREILDHFQQDVKSFKRTY